MREPIYHGITVAKLRELLSGLADDWVVYPNEIKNLAVGGRNLNGSYYFTGYIDLGSETLELDEDPAEPPK